MQRRDFLKTLSLGATVVASSNIPLFADTQSVSSDIFVSVEEMQTFLSVKDKLNAILRQVGFGNFNIITFDNTVNIARRVSSIGEFTTSEFDLIEKFFYDDPTPYGFFGNKTCANLTDVIKESDVYKVPQSGHYIFKGTPLNHYEKIIKDIGDSVILTSGVRSVVKQLSLYLNKIESVDYNISLASKTIAPPAYSYHSISDFDVGKKGLGLKNFTEEFANTDEFKRMVTLGYVELRYDVGNRDGVFFEPWHIKV
ncbi:M15 family metallopeptidase [Arcobacter sp. FWKO B]|uniref:M15 family metallopeptidase n=1 Tax=Arcobacter sp. FWKO B TaxID=2593672 RepID=UPI0018A417F6|nr:M15 family metallopeptidase [Arcobacter sp. FWKO B]QOG12424.1 twin-arginine translocation pathway signal protein [Arcobacter sp. FWKO B]